MIEYQTWLADALREEGLTVVEEPNWKTRSQPTQRDYAPIAVLNHHTAPPVPFPISVLLDKCNLNIKPDGTVHVVAAGYQYDSGMGSPEVLGLVKKDLPLPPEDLAAYKSTINGNPYFIDIEVDHLGNGSEIPTVQLEALIRCNVAICRHKGWDPTTKVIGHREWAPDRKIDPRWNGTANPMPDIREEVARRLLEDDVETLKIGDTGWGVSRLKLALNGWIALHSSDKTPLEINTTFDSVTEDRVKQFQSGSQIPRYTPGVVGAITWGWLMEYAPDKVEDHPEGGGTPVLDVETTTIEVVTGVTVK